MWLGAKCGLGDALWAQTLCGESQLFVLLPSQVVAHAVIAKVCGEDSRFESDAMAAPALVKELGEKGLPFEFGVE